MIGDLEMSLSPADTHMILFSVPLFQYCNYDDLSPDFNFMDSVGPVEMGAGSHFGDST